MTNVASSVGAITDELRIVPIGQLSEHPDNPRQHFDEKKLQELADSIKAKGIQVPLSVRPVSRGEVKYQILAGHRRYRAAKLAGIAQVPILVKYSLSDHDALELMIIDNLQRDDVHALDEAAGYQHLIKQHRLEFDKKYPAHPGKGGPVAPKYDTEAAMKSIAEKIGKSTSYIYQRLKLTGLIKEAQKALYDGRITPGHAILIARLQDADQKRALEVCTTISTDVFLDSKEFNTEGSAEDEGMISVKALQQWISEYIHVDIKSVAFDKDDPKLNAESGPCTTCRKLVGNDPSLHPEIKNKNTCTDHSCFRKKVKAHYEQAYKQYGNRLYPITTSTGGIYRHIDHQSPLEASEFTPQVFQQGVKRPGRWKAYTLKKGETEKTKRIKFGIFIEGERKGECIPISLVEPKKQKQSSARTKTASHHVSWEERDRLRKGKVTRAHLRFDPIAAAIWKNIPKTLPKKLDQVELLSELLFDDIASDLNLVKPKEPKLTPIQVINLALLCRKYKIDVSYDGNIHPDIFKAAKELGIKIVAEKPTGIEADDDGKSKKKPAKKAKAKRK